MSVKVMTTVWEQADCSQTELLVLLALADHAGDDGWCWPSVERIAERSRMSVRTAQRMLKALSAKERGLITREERGGRLTDRYFVNVAAMGDNVSPRQPVAPTTTAPGVTSTTSRGDSDVTQNHQEPTKEPTTSSSEVADATVRPEIVALLDHLDDRLRANGSKVPSRTKRNVEAARLLLDLDGRTVEHVHAAIDFATSDEFWRVNVRSMSKLRDKYDALRLSAQRHRAGPTGRLTPMQRARQTLELGARLAAEEEQGKAFDWLGQAPKEIAR